MFLPFRKGIRYHLHEAVEVEKSGIEKKVTLLLEGTMMPFSYNGVMM